MSQLIDLLNDHFAEKPYTNLNGKVFYRNFNWCLETFKVIHREKLTEVRKDFIVSEFNTDAPSMWSQRMRYLTQFDCTTESWESATIPSELSLSKECLDVLEGLGSYEGRIWEDADGSPLFPDALRNFFIAKISDVTPQTMTAFKSLLLRGLAFANSGDFLSTRLNRVTPEHIALIQTYLPIHNNDLEWIRWLGDNLKDLNLVFEDVARSRFLLTQKGKTVLNQARFSLTGMAKPTPLPARNLILFGPPGTGKTYSLTKDYFPQYQNRIRFVTFHQSFSYEDFVEGIKPVMDEGSGEKLTYQIQSGVFKEICLEARENKSQKYAIAIDEINRGNVASIFGELITLIEPDKREGQKNELSVTLPYSKMEFSVPSNLDIYGTMNTADRSVEALDMALRRRFEFEEIKPNWRQFDEKVISGIKVGVMLRTVNQRIEHLLDKDHCIGHSYFYNLTDFPSLQKVFAKNILPLLQEYFYGDFGKVGLILGDAFVQVRNESQTSFANFAHPDADLLLEKVVYDLKDPTTVKAEGYRAIYS